MDVISIIATVATVALFIWFTVVWIKKGFKKSILYLILSLAVLLVAFYFKTEDSEMTSRFIIGFPSVFMTVGGIFCTIGGENTKERINGLKVIVVSIVLFLILGLFGMNFTWHSRPENKYEDVWDKDPNTWTQDEKDYINEHYDWLNDN